MTRQPKNIAASVRQRLLDLARREGSDYNLLLVRYAHERLLHRLARRKRGRPFPERMAPARPVDRRRRGLTPGQLHYPV